MELTICRLKRLFPFLKVNIIHTRLNQLYRNARILLAPETHIFGKIGYFCF